MPSIIWCATRRSPSATCPGICSRKSRPNSPSSFNTSQVTNLSLSLSLRFCKLNSPSARFRRTHKSCVKFFAIQFACCVCRNARGDRCGSVEPGRGRHRATLRPFRTFFIILGIFVLFIDAQINKRDDVCSAGEGGGRIHLNSGSHLQGCIARPNRCAVMQGFFEVFVSTIKAFYCARSLLK